MVVQHHLSLFSLPCLRGPFKKKILAAYRQLKALLDREHYDIIHCHTPMGSVTMQTVRLRKNIIY